MKITFETCLKNKRIVEFPKGRELVGKEMRAAVDDLTDAEFGIAHERYKWSTIQGYYSMFHAARALLFSAGYRESSHRCLAVAIDALYVETGQLGREYFEYLYGAMGMREKADYRTQFSDESARLIVKRAEEFLDNARKILKGRRKMP